jgi:alpha-mannosidase
VRVRSRAARFAVVNAAGQQVPCQVTARAKGEVEIIFLAQEVPPLGYEVYRVLPGVAPRRFPGLRASRTTLENALVRVKLDRVGRVRSLYDKRADREVLAPGELGNRLQCFDDRPLGSDAWDVEAWFEEKGWEITKVMRAELVEAGPVRAVVRFTKRTEKSELIQDVMLYRHSPRLDFCTGVEWHEKRVLLKVAFPVDILSSHATYEIQYGAIERPTHRNTSWDVGRFEVTGHKWADLSEGGYGVSLPQ